ncbi:zinc-binding dehydrogenase [Devosia faecipullorum]|uniref:zinc-binding dehydrogenase n=1 Tax=Devosia faecipullorum TaxID=2755039 RepID=UPI00187B50AB|nr:zinc-binding dehydrogenase [Devosia faecipullorum]MBE7732853.1 zinc-binding dehydrogenase [Devosia faecipullorum]
MRAIVLREHGGPEKLTLADVDTPTPGAGEVLVRIHAAALNPVDAKIRNGLPIGPSLPAILGADMAGVVEAVGADVRGFAIGEAVYGCVGGVKGLGGTLASHVAADAQLLAKMPANLTFREAAALPLVAITAANVMERLAIVPGEKVLVHGGIGGVGHIAVQMAKAAGAYVVTTVSTPEAGEVARELGADAAVLRSTPVADYVAEHTGGRGFDAVIDTVGGENLLLSFEATMVRGRVATTNARTTIDLGQMHGKALSLHVIFMLLPLLTGQGRAAHGIVLRDVAGQVEAGKLRPLLDPHLFDLESAAEAHALLDSGKGRGKIVIDIV